MHDPARLAIVTRLYPRPYAPHIGAFNRQQFLRLREHYALSILVPVPFDEWLRHRHELGPTELDGIPVRYAGWVFPPKLGRTLYPACFGLSMMRELERLRAEQPDCLLASWAYPDAVGVLGWLKLARADIPVIIKAHGSDINVHARGAAHALQLRWAAGRAHALVCVSEALRQRAIALGAPADRVTVIRNGVDSSRFSPMPRAEARSAAGLAPERRTILFVGNLLPTKGVRELLEAFTGLAPRHPGLELVLVGEGEARAFVERQAQTAGLTDRVRLAGRIPHAELRVWFNAADLLCLPSYAEGLPNVVLEAMACGLPCVATNVGGIPEVIDAGSGLMVEPRDTRALAGALEAALTRQWSRGAILSVAAGFSWETNTQAMRTLIDEAIAARLRR